MLFVRNKANFFTFSSFEWKLNPSFLFIKGAGLSSKCEDWDIHRKLIISFIKVIFGKEAEIERWNVFSQTQKSY